MRVIEDRTGLILRRLEEQGYRLTATRTAIAEAIAARTGQFTARDLVEALEPRGIGRATVFRALDLLVQMGLLERLHGDLSCHSYTYCAPEHHHHLVCTSSSEITSATSRPVQRALPTSARQAHLH